MNIPVLMVCLVPAVLIFVAGLVAEGLDRGDKQ